jgi:hypothetical protein
VQYEHSLAAGNAREKNQEIRIKSQDSFNAVPDPKTKKILILAT